jgi:hypothetical protein
MDPAFAIADMGSKTAWLSAERFAAQRFEFTRPFKFAPRTGFCSLSTIRDLEEASVHLQGSYLGCQSLGDESVRNVE